MWNLKLDFEVTRENKYRLLLYNGSLKEQVPQNPQKVFKYGTPEPSRSQGQTQRRDRASGHCGGGLSALASSSWFLCLLQEFLELGLGFEFRVLPFPLLQGLP